MEVRPGKYRQLGSIDGYNSQTVSMRVRNREVWKDEFVK